MFVYIVNRDGELDVYAAEADAEEACSFLTDEGGEPLRYDEQVVFEPSSDHESTRDWLNELRGESSEP